MYRSFTDGIVQLYCSPLLQVENRNFLIYILTAYFAHTWHNIKLHT